MAPRAMHHASRRIGPALHPRVTLAAAAGAVHGAADVPQTASRTSYDNRSTSAVPVKKAAKASAAQAGSGVANLSAAAFRKGNRSPRPTSG